MLKKAEGKVRAATKEETSSLLAVCEMLSATFTVNQFDPQECFNACLTYAAGVIGRCGRPEDDDAVVELFRTKIKQLREIADKRDREMLAKVPPAGTG